LLGGNHLFIRFIGHNNFLSINGVGHLLQDSYGTTP
jgi:hypothetical protein